MICLFCNWLANYRTFDHLNIQSDPKNLLNYKNKLFTDECKQFRKQINDKKLTLSLKSKKKID